MASLSSWTPAPSGDSVKEPTWELPLLPTPDHVSVLSKIRRGVRFDFLQNPQNQKISKGAAAVPHAIPYRELDEAQQRPLFTHPPGDGRIPVWKGRSFDQYAPNGREPAGYGYEEEIVDFLQAKRSKSRMFRELFPKDAIDDPDTLPMWMARVAFRDVTNKTNSRTALACLIPPRTPLTHTAPTIIFDEPSAMPQCYVLGVFDSLLFDWLARRYIETHLTYFILNSLTFPPPANTDWQSIGRLAARLSCVDERFADFAAEAGVEYGPLADAQRNEMRAEIDALVAHAYGLTEDELRFIFIDFTENAVTPAYRKKVLEWFERL